MSEGGWKSEGVLGSSQGELGGQKCSHHSELAEVLPEPEPHPGGGWECKMH